ncbi:hypothetical protein AAE478_009767 [Parahypoxylon ruwenzoriense]
MAKLDEIEYKGIWGAGEIAVGSDRCFRDYSPGDTVVSFSESGQALYLCPIPFFPEPSQSQPEPTASESPLQAPERHRVTAEHETPNGSIFLSPAALLEVDQASSASHNDELSPLSRYLHDVQRDEKLALKYSTQKTPILCPGSPESASAAELRERLNTIESPGSIDSVLPEEQTEQLRRAMMLRRRVRSETHPREPRPTKVRKRNRDHTYASKRRSPSS